MNSPKQIYLCPIYFHLDALAKTVLLEQLQYNFSVAGPASLQLVGKTEDPVAVARQLYLHYMGTTHVTEGHAEGFMKVSSDVIHTTSDRYLLMVVNNTNSVDMQ